MERQRHKAALGTPCPNELTEEARRAAFVSRLEALVVSCPVCRAPRGSFHRVTDGPTGAWIYGVACNGCGHVMLFECDPRDARKERGALPMHDHLPSEAWPRLGS